MILRTSLALILLISFSVQAQTDLIHNAYNRTSVSLNGSWKYIIAPYETGYRNHRNWAPFDETASTKASAKPYYTDKRQQERWDRIEYNFDLSEEIQVPGDWNSQFEKLMYYEGSVWYRTTFEYQLPANQKLYLYFGAANYQTDVYLNGNKIGKHLGGFDPFNFDISQYLQEGKNSLVVRVDNRREKGRVPTLSTDWWNYGGIIRDVKLIELPSTFIQD